jgi:uncharacterized protein YjdB
MAEANLVKKGLATNSTDLSELQLAYFFYNTVADPLGNTTGDSTEALTNSYLNQGGNSIYTTFALASWIGATNESKASYSDATSESYTLEDSLAFDDAYHMQNAYWIKMMDTEDVKNMIMNYGAISASYYSDGQAYTSDYYDSTNFAYYYNGTSGTNHAIIIVGWDDEFDKSNFSTTPSNNGAWLVKNSWGTSYGDSGYFWLSYDDATLNKTSSQGCVFDFESADNYDHNYQYDGTSGKSSTYVVNGGSIANIFNAKANSVGGAEQIEAVSFALSDVNVDYSIQIYKNLTNEQNPTSGTSMLSTPQTGTTSYSGYYTVPLDEQVVVSEGTTFSVVITLSRSASSIVYYVVDRSYQNSTWIKFTNTLETGQSFEKFSYSSSWQDLSSYDECTARIKAFTSDTELVSPTKVSLNKSAVTLEKGTTTTLAATIAPTTATDPSITWSTSNGNVATVSSSGLVTAIGGGISTIKATTTNGLTASCQVTVQVVLPTKVSLNKSAVTLEKGTTTTLAATIAPTTATDPSITWSTSNGNVATVSSSGLVTAIGGGISTIKATTTNGLTASCQVTVQVSPTNISLNSSSVTVKCGENTTLTATIAPTTATNKSIIWSTSNSNIATVSSSGLVTVTGIGSASISATTTNGKTATCQVTGTIGKVEGLTATPSTKSIKLNWTKQYGVSGYVIYRYNSSTKKYVKIATNSKYSKNSYTDKSKSVATKYKYKVRAYTKVKIRKWLRH